MKIIFIFLLSALSEALSDQWIDPHDMNSNPKTYLKKSSSTGNLVRTSENCNVNIEENNSLIYLKRVINLLLNSADISRSDSLEHHGHLHFNINHEDLKFLKSFSGMKKVTIEDLRKMDTILSKSLERTYFDTVMSMVSSAQEKVYQLVSNQNCLPLLALSFCFPYIVYNLFKSNFSVWYAVRYFILMVFMIDFVQRYQQLSEEAEEHNMHLKYSSKCDTSKMTWSEYFKFLSSHEDCEKKVVSLLEVGLNQMKSVIIVPLAALGTGMGQFGSELWRNLPFPWNILIFPIMLIFCAILAAIVMTTMNNTPFKFNIMHLFHLEFGHKKPEITGKTLDKILEAVSHRPLLQEVKFVRDKTPPQEESSNKSVETCKEAETKSNKENDSQDVTSQNQTDSLEKSISKEDNNMSPGNSD